MYIGNSLNVGSPASPTQIISSTGTITAPSVSANSLNINSLASIGYTGKASSSSLNINSLATIDSVGKLTTKSLSVNSIVNTLSNGQITTSSTIGCGGIQVTDVGGISRYDNATTAKTSRIPLTGDITCNSLSTIGATASITQAGAISGSSISTIGNISASGNITSQGNYALTTT